MIEYQVKVYYDRTEWRLNGNFHREDGPAIEYANGHKSWYLNGQFLTEEEFNNRIKSFLERGVKKVIALMVKNKN